MKASKKQSGTKLKLSKGKRVSLRCPLSVDRTDLEYNYDTSALQVCMTVENMGGGGLASDTVESAVIVVRLFGNDGQIIPCGDKEYFAKLIRFGEEGLASGSHITFRLIPDCGAAGLRAEDTEIYISRIRYTDGTVTDFVRGDFFDLPDEGILLTKKFKKDPDSALEALGEGATYVPENLTEIVWRCTCGEFSESDTCPTCGRSKAELFAALDALTAPKSKKGAAVVIPVAGDGAASFAAGDNTSASALGGEENLPPAGDQTAEYPAGPARAAALAAMESGDSDSSVPPVVAPPHKKEEKKPDRVKTILLISISAASVILLAIILLLILTLCGRRDPGEGSETTEDPGISQPSPEEAAEQIVRSYLDQNAFDNALGYAINANCPDELIQEICSAAVQYYTEQNQFEEALEWAERQGDTAMVDSLNVLLFSQKLSAGDFEGAMEIANSLPADQQEAAKAQASEGYVQSLVASGKYEEAMNAADQYQTATTSADIANTAIENYLSAKEFDSAIAMAESKGLTDKIASSAKAAAQFYAGLSDYSRAAQYVGRANDTVLTKEILNSLSDVQLRMNLPTFFSLLSFDKMQAVHASPISAKPQMIAAIDDTGNIFLGDQMIHNAEETGLEAVSLSCCDTAVVALFSNGTVMIVEGTNASYTQEDIADWKDIVAISAGNYHLLGLTKNGRVVAVGSNLNGQCNTSSIRNAVSVSAGDNHSLILLSDGSVTALGNNVGGICNTQNWSGIVSIAAGTLHSIGLKSDGTVVALGNCDVSEFTNVVAIFSSATSAVGLKTDGSLVYSISGKPSDTLDEMRNVIWVSVGKLAVTVLHADGTLSVPGHTSPDPSLLAGLPLNTDVFGVR